MKSQSFQFERGRFVLFATPIIFALIATSCGGDATSPVAEPSPLTTAQPAAAAEIQSTSVAPASQAQAQAQAQGPAITACDLLPEAEAEAIVGADLELIPASDDFRCSYDGGIVEGKIIGALLSISVFESDEEDLNVLRDALAPETIEDLPGLGDAAFYHDAGALHDLQFVKNGVWVTIAVNGVVGSDDVRAAEMQIAVAAAARL